MEFRCSGRLTGRIGFERYCGNSLLRMLNVRALKVAMTITRIQNLDVSFPAREGYLGCTLG